MDDPLDELIGAYRAEHERGGSDPEARARLMRAMHRRHGRRRHLAFGLVVGAIVLSNATTWAWSTGRVDALLGLAGEAPTEAPASDERVAVDAPEERPAPEEELAELERALALPPELAHEPPVHPRRASPSRPVEAPSIADGPQGDDAQGDDPLGEALAELEPDPDAAERRLFAEAHRLHFGAQPERALRRWDTYLTLYPDGRFVPEARYNRAIALLRLGRADEARRALGPIAEGAYGEAHRADAARLRRAIDEGRVRGPAR